MEWCLLSNGQFNDWRTSLGRSFRSLSLSLHALVRRTTFLPGTTTNRLANQFTISSRCLLLRNSPPINRFDYTAVIVLRSDGDTESQSYRQELNQAR